MLQSAYFLAKIGADTAENAQHFAERRGGRRRRGAAASRVGRVGRVNAVVRVRVVAIRVDDGTNR